MEMFPPVQPDLPRKRTLRKAFLDLGQSLAFGVVLALVLQLVVQPTIVFGQSMEPSLHENERVIVDKVSYRISLPSRGDIVIFPVAGEPLPLIKRVIGLPGDIVQVQDGKVWVNGAVLDEPYASGPTEGNTQAVQVPEGAIFVMGDNRKFGGSLDSRRLGPIALDKIIGRASLAFWPPANWGKLPGLVH